MKMHRGQALLEMVISLPLFLLAFFGLIWSVQTWSMSERLQVGVRYGGLVTQNEQPYESYSLYALYATIDGQPSVTSTKCSLADATATVVGRHTFWQSASVAMPICAGQSTVVTGPETFSAPIIVQNNYLLLSASAAAPNYLLSHNFSSLTSASTATQNFFRSPDVGTLASCTGIGSVVKASLEGFYDHTTPLGTLSFIPNTVAPSTLSMTPGACPTATYSPLPSVPVDTPVPVPPQYTPPPQYNGQATPVPGPSSTATPSGPTPVPTVPPVVPPAGSVS